MQTSSFPARKRSSAMSNEALKVDLIREARSFFDLLLARLQALDAEHASNGPQDTDALKLYLASASALLKAGEALIHTRSGAPTPNRAARLADLVDQTKEACRIAYRAALLITDEASVLDLPAGPVHLAATP